MYVTVFTYRVRPGQEDIAIALHEEWERQRGSRVAGYLGGELLVSQADPCQFIDIARFADEAAARANANDSEQDAWYRRLVSLLEAEPVFTDCSVAWQPATAAQAVPGR